MTTVGVSANRLEILQIAKAVAEEKSIDQRIVIEAMQEAIEKAAKAKYGQEHDIRARIDPATGEQTLWRVQTVVAEENFEDEAKQLRLAEAKKIDASLEVGSELKEELPPFDFGRVAAQTAKQVITQKVRDAERERQYNEYKDRVGEVINGIVKRVEYGHVIVDLGRAEGIIRRNDGIPRENFQPNDRVRAYLYKVSRELKGPQIFLSRAAPDFMRKLFAQEVPEVYEGVIQIKACARDPGSRAKIGVISNDSSIDPVGACVGMRGVRLCVAARASAYGVRVRSRCAFACVACVDLRGVLRAFCGRSLAQRAFARIGTDAIGKGVVDALRTTRSPAVLVVNHGPFTVGRDARAAVKTAVMCEDVCRTVHIARQLGDPKPIGQADVEDDDIEVFLLGALQRLGAAGDADGGEFLVQLQLL